MKFGKIFSLILLIIGLVAAPAAAQMGFQMQSPYGGGQPMMNGQAYHGPAVQTQRQVTPPFAQRNSARIVGYPGTANSNYPPISQPTVRQPNAGYPVNNSVNPNTYFDAGCSGCQTGCDSCVGAGGCGIGPVIPACWTETRFKATANVLYMTRESSKSFPLIINGNGGTILSAGNFDFNFELGAEAGLQIAAGPSGSLDFRYIQLDNLNSQIIPGVVAPTDQLVTTPPSPFQIPANGAIGYTIDLYGAEVNAMRCFGANTRVGLGFRYIELTELLESNFSDLRADTISLDWGANNYMYGGQMVGETLLLLTNRVRVEFIGRLGVFANNASRDFLYTVNGVTQVQNRLEDNVTSLVAENTLKVSMRLAGCVSVNAGYNVTGFTGIAMAPDQVNRTTAATAFQPIQVDMSGIIYHGGFLGLEIRR